MKIKSKEDLKNKNINKVQRINLKKVLRKSREQKSKMKIKNKKIKMKDQN